MAKGILMRRGLIALVDDQDYEWAKRWSWCSNEKEPGRHYAYRSARGGRTHIHLHRALVERILKRKLRRGQEVDHKNGVTLDNTRYNLRVATRQQQLANRVKGMRNGQVPKSWFKGVNFMGPSRPGGKPRTKPWAANCQSHQIGYFQTEEEAARAYDQAAHRIYGEFAKVNFP